MLKDQSSKREQNFVLFLKLKLEISMNKMVSMQRRCTRNDLNETEV